MSSQTALPAHFRRTMSAGRTRHAVAHRRPERSVAVFVLRFCGQTSHAVPAGLPWRFRPKNTAFCALIRIRKGRTIFRTATRGSRPAKDKAALFRSFSTKAARPFPFRAVLPFDRLFRETPVATSFRLLAGTVFFRRTGRRLPEASGGCRRTERHADRPHEPFHTSFA